MTSLLLWTRFSVYKIDFRGRVCFSRFVGKIRRRWKEGTWSGPSMEERFIVDVTGGSAWARRVNGAGSPEALGPRDEGR